MHCFSPRLLPVALSLLTLAACGDDSEFYIPPTPPAPQAPVSDVAQRMETPEALPGNRLLAHYSTEGGKQVLTYSLEYVDEAYHSRWVAFRFDALTRQRNVGRKPYEVKPQYPADPLLPEGVAIGNDASFQGYQHGHLVASADRLYSRTANDNTFFMTNMSPQRGRFNSPYWSAFEGHVQSLGRNAAFADTLYVVKGGTIAAGQYEGKTCSGRIPIPRYYFIALLKAKRSASGQMTYSSIAFLTKHADYDDTTPSPAELRRCTLSVNDLESFTGINFFPNLPDAAEERIESQYAPQDWGLPAN